MQQHGSMVANICIEISHAGRGTINMNHIKRELDRRPGSDPLGGLRRWGQKVKKFFFQNMVMLHINFKGNYARSSNMVAYIFTRRRPPPTLRVGPKGQNSTYSEYGPVAYQIKGKDACSNMVETIFCLQSPPPPTLGVGPKGQNSTFSEQLFQNMVMLHIKLKGNYACSNMEANILITHAATWKQIFLPADPHWGWGQNVKIQLFQNMVMLHSCTLNGIMKAAAW